MSYFERAKPKDKDDLLDFIEETTGNKLEIIVPIEDHEVIMTRWGVLTRQDVIKRLCAAFPVESEVIQGLADLNKDKWPKLEMVGPGENTTVSMPGRQLFTIDNMPRYRLVWVTRSGGIIRDE